jgi:hypothetical protein
MMNKVVDCPHTKNCRGELVFFTRRPPGVISGRSIDFRCEHNFKVMMKVEGVEIRTISRDEYETHDIISQ